jgi:hypothetical protein
VGRPVATDLPCSCPMPSVSPCAPLLRSGCAVFNLAGHCGGDCGGDFVDVDWRRHPPLCAGRVHPVWYQHCQHHAGQGQDLGPGAHRHTQFGASLCVWTTRAPARVPHVTGMTATVWGNTEVGANGRLRRTTVNGVGPDMLAGLQHQGPTGQFLPDEALENARAFVVLGSRLKSELFGSRQPAGGPGAGGQSAVSGDWRVGSQGPVFGCGPGRRGLHSHGAGAGTVQPRRPDEN